MRLQITHPAQERLATRPRDSAVRRDLLFFRPYPRSLESLTVCRCHYTGSTFFSVIQGDSLVLHRASLSAHNKMAAVKRASEVTLLK